MKWIRFRDPRLALAWHQLTLPTGEVRLVAAFDAAQDRSGLGVRDGVQAYRDGLGRRFQVPLAYFQSHAKPLDAKQVASQLPPLDADTARLRFGLAPEGLAKLWPRRTKARPAARRPPNRSMSGKPLAPSVEIRLIRRARKLESGVE